MHIRFTGLQLGLIKAAASTVTAPAAAPLTEEQQQAMAAKDEAEAEEFYKNQQELGENLMGALKPTPSPPAEPAPTVPPATTPSAPATAPVTQAPVVPAPVAPATPEIPSAPDVSSIPTQPGVEGSDLRARMGGQPLPTPALNQAPFNPRALSQKDLADFKKWTNSSFNPNSINDINYFLARREGASDADAMKQVKLRTTYGKGTGAQNLEAIKQIRTPLDRLKQMPF